MQLNQFATSRVPAYGKCRVPISVHCGQFSDWVYVGKRINSMVQLKRTEIVGLLNSTPVAFHTTRYPGECALRCLLITTCDGLKYEISGLKTRCFLFTLSSFRAPHPIPWNWVKFKYSYSWFVSLLIDKLLPPFSKIDTNNKFDNRTTTFDCNHVYSIL